MMADVDRKTNGLALVVGIYLTDQPNYFLDIASELRQSTMWHVEQRWVAMGSKPAPADASEFTVDWVNALLPKFVVLNRVLRDIDLSRYEYLILCDDDIILPTGFLDAYIGWLGRYDFALAQPARTHDSFIDHPFVDRLDGLTARQTRFVEIGPLLSIRRDAFSILLPFDETSPMGWGYDFIWPCLIEQAGLKMGIIDALPVAHNLRKPTAHYSADNERKTMKEYLASHPHLSKEEAFSILESYA
jgi:hypothetical protein